MAFLLFWVKATLKRIIEFVKTFPVVTIGGIIIASAVIYTYTINFRLTNSYSLVLY
jgi:hypothetical protein